MARASGPYALFLKACKGWRDPNVFTEGHPSHHPEVGRNLCLGCVARYGPSYLKPLGPHRYDDTCERRRQMGSA